MLDIFMKNQLKLDLQLQGFWGPEKAYDAQKQCKYVYITE